jgi:hypothetical protein
MTVFRFEDDDKGELKATEKAWWSEAATTSAEGSRVQGVSVKVTDPWIFSSGEEATEFRF